MPPKQQNQIKTRINRYMLTYNNINRVQVALINDKRNKTNIRHQQQETNLLSNPISPWELRKGGAAILQAVNRNHNIAILGIKLYPY